jgi:hypothetical protein
VTLSMFSRLTSEWPFDGRGDEKGQWENNRAISTRISQLMKSCTTCRSHSRAVGMQMKHLQPFPIYHAADLELPAALVDAVQPSPSCRRLTRLWTPTAMPSPSAAIACAAR